MRPINRGSAPRTYTKYEDAKQDLVNQLGSYCSYCERRIVTLLAVEHIQPKSLPQYAHLETEWTNFLLACVNCNSAKLATPVEFDQFIMPDRDNTFVAFKYEENGRVEVLDTLTPAHQAMASATCELVALNRLEHQGWKEDMLFSALERISQRVQAWIQAKEARLDYENGRSSARAIAREAASAGLFSIWMAAFEGCSEVRKEIIKAFPNTAMDCFDQATDAVSPRPSNGLAHGGKL